ncbi:MAG: lactate utilization protein [Oscillospiraceae bacterium]
MQEKTASIKARYRLLSSKIIKNLESRKFEATYCDTAAQAVQTALSLIPEGALVSWGGSVTLVETGLLEQVKQGPYTVIDRDTAASPAARYDLMRQALLCDVYLTSFNAISEDGVLFNVDSTGNRVAAIAFGPKNVVALVGMNKVCKTTEGALERARTYAAPINVQRAAINPHFRALQGTPCVLNGSCGNCKAEDCSCSYVVETRMCRPAGRIKIILVGEPLGF